MKNVKRYKIGGASKTNSNPIFIVHNHIFGSKVWDLRGIPQDPGILGKRSAHDSEFIVP